MRAFYCDFEYIGSKTLQDYNLQVGSDVRLLSQIESLAIGLSSSFLCHVHCAWVAFTTSSCPCPKLASLNTDIAGCGFINLSNTRDDAKKNKNKNYLIVPTSA